MSDLDVNVNVIVAAFHNTLSHTGERRINTHYLWCSTFRDDLNKT